MDRKMLLSMLTDEMLLDMLEGCQIVQGGMIGVVEGKMLKTNVGKVDIQPSSIVSIIPATKLECSKCSELEKELTKVKNALAGMKELDRLSKSKTKTKANKEDKE